MRGEGARLADGPAPDPVDVEVEVGVEVDAARPDFDEFFRANYRDVVGLVAALSGRRHVAEELAQEAFVRAYRRWNELVVYDRPGAWVRRVAVNLAYSSVRRAAAEARALARLRRTRDRDATGSVVADDEFWHAVRRLPSRQAQCIALRYLEDRSIGDIATILDIDAATVRVHLHRGRAALARELGADAKGDEA